MVEESLPESWLPTYLGTILHFRTALRLDIKYCKVDSKFREVP